MIHLKLLILFLVACGPLHPSLADPAGPTGASFEEKFSLVAPDISALSGQNRQRLRNALAKQRNLGALEVEAAKLVADADAGLVLNHATSLDAAVAILKGGEILSVDELVRRKLRDPGTMANTYEATDGRIGEQDVVYLGLQTPNHPFDFGPVAFEFEKDPVFDAGYFSLNSFTNGWQYNHNDATYSLDQMIGDYRPMVFKGSAAYRELILLSLVNDIALRSNADGGVAVSEAGKIKKDYDEAFLKMGATGKFNPDFQAAVAAYDLLPLLARVGQVSAPPCSELFESQKALIKKEEIKLRSLNNALLFTQAQSPSEKALRSFAFFPPYREDKAEDPVALRNVHNFWEVKVPRALSLSISKSVSMRDYQPGEARSERFRAAVEQFAASRGWKLTQRTEAGPPARLTFDFLKPGETNRP